jgi:hypothetical protein
VFWAPGQFRDPQSRKESLRIVLSITECDRRDRASEIFYTNTGETSGRPPRENRDGKRSVFNGNTRDKVSHGRLGDYTRKARNTKYYECNCMDISRGNIARDYEEFPVLETKPKDETVHHLTSVVPKVLFRQFQWK